VLAAVLAIPKAAFTLWQIPSIHIYRQIFQLLAMRGYGGTWTPKRTTMMAMAMPSITPLAVHMSVQYSDLLLPSRGEEG